MGCLPDELWTKVLKMGVERRVLDHRDLCSLAFVCRRIKKLCYTNCIWRPLWEQDQAELMKGSGSQYFGAESAEMRKETESKGFRDLYRIRFEKVRAAKMAAHRRRVYIVESRLAVLQREAQHFQRQVEVECQKLLAALTELRGFELARRSAVALQVWQPQSVRARQQEVLEQQSVNAGARHRSLEMEITVCRERVRQFEKSVKMKREAIEKTKEELEAVTFNPSRVDSDRKHSVDRLAVKRKRDTSSSFTARC